MEEKKQIIHAQAMIDQFGHLFKLQKTMRFHHPRMVQGLMDWCKLIPQGAYGIEVGSFAGESSLIILNSVPDVQLICVDPWLPDYYSNKQIPAAEKCFDNAIKDYNPSQVTKVKMTSDDFLPHVDQLMDFVYIDGNHNYEFVKRDIENSLKILKPGGILGGHDYRFKGSPGVIKALLEVMGREADHIFPDYSFAYKIPL